jgi:uncharacterized membrane protein YdbT with pleckstrin-like domain
MQPTDPVDYDQPVAYDNQGKPLYAHPPAQSAGDSAQASSPMEASELNAKTNQLHQDSVAHFPEVNLSEEEYVVSEVTRYSGGLIMPIVIAVVLGLLIVAALSLYSKLVPSGNPPFSSLLLPAALLLALIALGTYIVVWVYQKNRMFITNESIIQQVQLNLFSRNEKTVDLSDVKDISYSQSGILQTMFDYGTIVLTVESDDQTYKFSNVTSPKKVANMLNSILEDFKNGRPISEPSIVDPVSAAGSF